VNLSAASVEAFADALLEAGAQSVELSDARAGSELEQPLFSEPEDENAFGWEDNRLVALFAAGTDIDAALDQAARRSGIHIPDYRTARVEDSDWVALNRSQFQPVRISSRLWVLPTWCKPVEPTAINVVLDPGLAFGTGTHATTRLCLRWLDEHLLAGQSVIDYGCGSGILAIAAAKIGAGRVTGVDIDPRALEVSRYNAKQNEVAVQFVGASAAPPEPADLVIANILSSPLKSLAPLLSGLTRSGGKLVLSGILTAQSEAVAAAYRPWFELSCGAVDEGWVRLEGMKRAATSHQP
jgi:ribosomal protein L11 methyltransferase